MAPPRVWPLPPLKSICSHFTIALFLLVSGPAAANPDGGTVAAGEAQISGEGSAHLTVQQSSDQAIIDWRSFSIGQGEHTEFVQPSATSLTVNRVTGGDASRILGQLSANGRVMLINPNGVLFGAGSRVDVSGLVATTIDIPNARLLAGDFRFDLPGNTDATVINRGTITIADGGLAALVAPGVVNSGVIRARLGRIALAAGEAFTLDFYGDRLVEIEVPVAADTALNDETGAPLSALAANSGRIEADGGDVLVSARTVSAVIDSVINMDGIVEARSVGEINGEIVLDGGERGVVRVAGRLDASGEGSGESGGKVSALGERIGLFNGAEVDVSAPAGGGEVLVGGNFQGNGPEANASVTYVSAGATIQAQATEDGDGGRVIVWADESTRYYGEIDVSAGPDGGNGGFVEVSGKQNLDFAGTVSLQAPAGSPGALLLDPLNIVVQTGGGAAASDVDAFADNAGTTQTIDPATLVGVGGSITLEATNNITFTNALTLTAAGATLTARAQNTIIVNAAVATNNGAITLSAVDMTLSAAVNSGTATTTLLNPNNGHTIGLGAAAGYTLNLTNAELQNIATTGGLIIGHATNTASITIASDITPGSGGGANVTSLRLNTAGAVTGTAGGIIENNLAISAGGNVALTDASSDVDSFAASAPGFSVTLTDADAIAIASVAGISGVSTSNFALTAGGGVTDSASITANNLGISAGGTVTLDDASTDINKLAITAAGHTVSFRDVDDVQIDSVIYVGITAATFNLTAGSVTDVQAITATNFSLTASGTVTLDMATTDVDTLAISASGQSVSFRDADGFDIGSVGGINGATATTLALTAGGAVTDSQAITATNLAITGSSGITLDVATSNVDVLAISASGQSVSFRDADGLDIGSVGGVNGITATTFALTAGGAVTDSQAITATNFLLNAGGTATLDVATSDVDVIAVSAAGQSVAFRDADGIDIGSVGGVNGIAAGTFALTAGGAVTDSQAIAATNLAVTATGTVTLDVATSDVDMLAVSATGQSVSFRDADGLDIGSVGGVNGITATTFSLTAGGAVTDSQAITATNLLLNASGTATLDMATSDVDVLAISASGQSVSFRDADGIDIGSVGGVNGIAATTFALTAGGAVTDSQAIVATNLAVTATGTVTLDVATSDVDTLAISAAGQSITFRDADGLDLGSVAGVNGITAGTFALTAGGAVTDSQAIAATNLAITGSSGITLDVATSDVDVLAISASGQSVSFRDSNGLDIGSVGGINGVTATTFALTAGSAVTDSQAIAATNLALTAGGTVTLDVATSDVDTLAISASGQSVAFRDADGLDLGSVGGVNGITATTFALTAGGAVTDSQAMTATNLAVTATGTVTLDVATSDIDVLAISASGQSVSFRDADGIDIGSVGGINGVAATTFALTAGGAVTDNQATVATSLAITAGGSVTLDVAANDIDSVAIAATGQTVTLVDSDDLTVGSVGGINGIAGSAIALTAGTSLSVANTAAAADISASGSLTLAFGTASNLTLAAGSAVQATGAASIRGGNATGTGTLAVASLRLSTQRTNLTGTVGGLTGAAAAAAVTTQAPFGDGPHTLNGVTVTPTVVSSETTTPASQSSGTASATTTTTAMRALAAMIAGSAGLRQAATGAGGVIGGFAGSGDTAVATSSGPRSTSPRDVAFAQDGSQRSYELNAFAGDYPLLRLSESANEAFGKIPQLESNPWRNSTPDGIAAQDNLEATVASSRSAVLGGE